MNVKHKVFVLGAVLVLLVNLQANAGPVLTDSANLLNWQNIGSAPFESQSESSLTIKFGAVIPAQYQEDTVYYSADSGQVGVFGGLSLHFSFNAMDFLPVSSLVYLHSTGSAAGDYWSYDFVNSGATTGAEVHNVSFASSLGWEWVGVGDAPVFSDSMSNVDWIGVNVVRSSSDVERYQLSDWGYYESTAVPEPGVVCVLMSALLSMALIFRKRIRFARA